MSAASRAAAFRTCAAHVSASSARVRFCNQKVEAHAASPGVLQESYRVSQPCLRKASGNSASNLPCCQAPENESTVTMAHLAGVGDAQQQLRQPRHSPQRCGAPQASPWWRRVRVCSRVCSRVCDRVRGSACAGSQRAGARLHGPAQRDCTDSESGASSRLGVQLASEMPRCLLAHAGSSPRAVRSCWTARGRCLRAASAYGVTAKLC